MVEDMHVAHQSDLDVACNVLTGAGQDAISEAQRLRAEGFHVKSRSSANVDENAVKSPLDKLQARVNQVSLGVDAFLTGC